MTRDAGPGPVLVVAGMHRSGTSFLASLLQRCGCRMGGPLLPADEHNPLGYFEDVEFLALNRRMLASVTRADQPGHADWGWIDEPEGAPIDARALQPFVDEADALVARRREGGVCWGWKDPRTTLLLDFWNDRVPDARYVFIYRSPWDVADSMQRLGADVFLRHPEYAYRVWHHYNRALLAFRRQHPERTLLTSAKALLNAPDRLPAAMRDRFGLDLTCADVSQAAQAAQFLTTGADHPIASLAAAVHPECADLLRELEAAADLPSGDPAPLPLAAPPRESDASLAIVIPCFNHGEFVLDAIASVEHAVSVPYDLIIVNDGSDDRHTLDVLARLRRAGYRILESGHRGLAHARNAGIREANRPFFLPLDADNRVRAGFIEAALDVLARRPEVMAVYGDRVEFGLRSGRVQVGVPDLNRMLCGNYVDACAVIRTDAWRACGGYDPGMPTPGAEDWDFWLSLLEHGFVLHRLDLPAFDYRVRPDSMLSSFADPEVQIATERYVLAKHAPLYLEHLRRQVSRLEVTDRALADAKAEIAALRHRG